MLGAMCDDAARFPGAVAIRFGQRCHAVAAEIVRIPGTQVTSKTAARKYPTPLSGVGDPYQHARNILDGPGTVIRSGVRLRWGIHSVVRRLWLRAEDEFTHVLGAYESTTAVNTLLIRENTPLPSKKPSARGARRSDLYSWTPA